MQAISTMQGNLASLAKDMEGAQKKSDKLKDKGAKAAGKVANATSEVENATAQWESQAPFVFEKLQAVDESRLNHLRDVLTQFQTHEVDQVERNRVTAEECLNTLLNVETADEIASFAARATGGRPKTERQKSRTSAGGTLAPSTPNRAADDAQSQRSGVSESPGKSTAGKRRISLNIVNECPDVPYRNRATSRWLWRPEATGNCYAKTTKHGPLRKGAITRKAINNQFQAVWRQRK